MPVSVVAPIPSLETPTTGRFSYEGSDTNTDGFVYPVPPAPIENVNVPPTPTVAEILATSPTCPDSKTLMPMDTNPLYPEPLKLLSQVQLGLIQSLYPQ